LSVTDGMRRFVASNQFGRIIDRIRKLHKDDL
jgi:hypothetical protein